MYIITAAFFLAASALLYYIHYLIFHDEHHIFIFLMHDIAFLPLEVFLVVVVIERILTRRDKQAILYKLNMVIGAFFSEVGTNLLKFFAGFDKNAEQISKHLIVGNEWSPEHFTQMQVVLSSHDYKIDSRAGDLKGIREFLIGKRGFLLGLLENPNLLEHEKFTELLWAVFHLAEELSHRTTIEGLPETDYYHLSGDIGRSQRLLVREWLSHMEHLKSDYPYLFSLAVRTNPFDPNASVEVQ